MEWPTVRGTYDGTKPHELFNTECAGMRWEDLHNAKYPPFFGAYCPFPKPVGWRAGHWFQSIEYRAKHHGKKG